MSGGASFHMSGLVSSRGPLMNSLRLRLALDQ